jgi:hypothetical protein
VILIQTVACESLIGQNRDLMRELRHFPEGVFEPILAQLVSAGGKTDSPFEQARGIRLDRETVGDCLSCDSPGIPLTSVCHGFPQTHLATDEHR